MLQSLYHSDVPTNYRNTQNFCNFLKLSVMQERTVYECMKLISGKNHKDALGVWVGGDF